MRVVIDVRHLDDYGYGTYIRNLVRALAAIDTETQYLLTARPQDAARFAGLPSNFEVIPFAGIADSLKDHVAYPWFVRRLHADVIHFPLNRVPYFLPRPYVVTVHDMSSLLFPEKRNWRYALGSHLFRHGLTRAERIIAVSQATSADVQTLIRIPAARIRVVYGAPDPAFFCDDDPAFHELCRRTLERYAIDYPFLLYVGRIQPHKNVPRLVEAFSLVRERLAHHPIFKDLRLIIIGDEIHRDLRLRRVVTQTGLGKAKLVRFLGFVPFEVLRVFYARAAAFVFPSLYEGFGLPPLEAMAMGTPVVTTAVSSLQEAVGDAALLVNPESVFDLARAIVEVLTDDALRRELIARGLERARSFSWLKTASEVRTIYLEAAGLRPAVVERAAAAS